MHLSVPTSNLAVLWVGCQSDEQMSNLRLFPGITDKNHDPDVMLKLAQGKLVEVVIVGFGKDGEIFFSSNVADGGAILWLFEKAKKMLLSFGDDHT